jgi:hypothetical protein
MASIRGRSVDRPAQADSFVGADGGGQCVGLSRRQEDHLDRVADRVGALLQFVDLGVGYF